jgi:hypothetical protein
VLLEVIYFICATSPSALLRIHGLIVGSLMEGALCFHLWRGIALMFWVSFLLERGGGYLCGLVSGGRAWDVVQVLDRGWGSAEETDGFLL